MACMNSMADYGWGALMLCIKYEIKPEAAWNFIWGMGKGVVKVKPETPKRKIWTDEENRLMIRMKLEGKTNAEIAYHFGTNAQNICARYWQIKDKYMEGVMNDR